MGIVLIVGGLLFIVAAFLPITMRVLTTPDLQKRIGFIADNRGSWLLSNILFALGSIISIIGLVLFGLHVQNITNEAGVRLGVYLAAALAGLGAVFWVIVVYKRAVLPPQDVAGNLGINAWMFPLYTVLTQIALMIVGWVLIQSGYPTWLGWGMLILAALSLVAFIVFKDMPPFVYYILLLIMGIALLG